MAQINVDSATPTVHDSHPDGESRVSDMRYEFPGRSRVEDEILSLAAFVCLDEAEALRWYFQDTITVLGGVTAVEWVWRGEAERVLSFLRSVLCAELQAARALRPAGGGPAGTDAVALTADAEKYAGQPCNAGAWAEAG